MSDSSRNFAIDGIRAVAALLGVAVHAAASYMVYPIPQWPSLPQSNLFFDLFACAIHAFRVPVFFFLAGFLSYYSYHRKNIRTFVTHRVCRIAIPFLIFMFITNFPYLLVNFMLHRISSVGDFISVIANTSYLWFLDYLLLYHGITIIVLYMLKWVRTESIQKMDVMLKDFFRNRYVSFFIVLNFLFLYELNAWYSPILLNLTPNFLLLANYALSFFLGWFLCRYNLLFVFFKFKKSFVVYALVAYLAYTGIYLYAYHSELSRVIALFFYVIMSWSLFFVFISFSLRIFTKANRVLSYLSEASYWIYLVHVPLLLYIQYGFSGTTMPLFLQFIVSWFSTLVICLVTYPLLRNSWIGQGKLDFGWKRLRALILRQQLKSPSL